MHDALILFAHGARDPRWSAPFEAVAARVRATRPGVPVRLAFLEFMAPGLVEAGTALVRAGHGNVAVLPMFLGTGRHARQDLPVLVAGLRDQHPQVQFEVATAVGEDPRLTALLAEMAHQYIA